MKINKYEKLEEKYHYTCDDVQIGIDETDHIVFICKECKNPLEIIKVFSKNVAITTNGKTKDNCTWIYVVCHNCKTLGKRKFYWKSEDGKYCFNRTKDANKIYTIDGKMLFENMVKKAEKEVLERDKEKKEIENKIVIKRSVF